MPMGTKYYVVYKINGQINAIHDDGLELTGFMSHFIPEQQQPPQAQDSDSNSGLQSIEDLTGMGFCSPNYSPILLVRNANQQQPMVLLLTSTPILDGGLGLNTLDPTHNRGKVKIINSFTEPQEPPKKSLKGGKVKSSQGMQLKNEPKLSTSSHTPSNSSWRPLVH